MTHHAAKMGHCESLTEYTNLLPKSCFLKVKENLINKTNEQTKQHGNRLIDAENKLMAARWEGMKGWVNR